MPRSGPVFFLALLCTFLPHVCCCQVREGLRDYAPDGFSIGGALHGDTEGFRSKEYRNVARTEFNAVTSTIYMGWGGWPNPHVQPTVSRLTNVIDWGRRNGMKVHGHSLVYPLSNKNLNWFNQLPDKEIPEYLGRFIDAVAGTRTGQIWVWDVVNEAIADPGQPMDFDGVRTDFKEYRAMGSRYIDFAFQRAKLADPKALLILNDYGIAELNDKSNRLFNFVVKLKKRGVPIDGVGFQMHFMDLKQRGPNTSSIKRNFQRFADAGFQLFVTEMDVCSIATSNPHPNSPGISTPSPQQLERQTLFFGEITKIALQQPKCKALLLWDFADDHSWLHGTNRKLGDLSPGTYTHPTPFWCGKHCPISKKPAYYSILNALKAARKSSR